jgi:fumarylacetoacetase
MTSGFGRDELPYGVFRMPGRFEEPHIGVAVEDRILDLASLFADPIFHEPSLNAFMAQGREAWTSTRRRIREALDRGAGEHLVLARDAVMQLPFEVADFVDFNSSLQHATNAGRILRPGDEPVRPSWRQMPVGYHGRSGTIVVSGMPVTRPHGPCLDPTGAAGLAPTQCLDVEAEVGFVVGPGSTLGEPVPTSDFAEHVFGVVLVLDWSARDIQALEYVPLGPFLGKSFATSISAWVLPLEALEAARVPAPTQTPPVAGYLHVDESWGLDVRLEFEINGTVVSRPRFDSMYWTPPQQLAHLTVNGARVRPGDLFGSGTVSDSEEFGSLLELSWNGERPFALADGSTRGYRADGDQVRLGAVAHCGRDGARLHVGDVRGTVLPARQLPGAAEAT